MYHCLAYFVLWDIYHNLRLPCHSILIGVRIIKRISVSLTNIFRYFFYKELPYTIVNVYANVIRVHWTYSGVGVEVGWHAVSSNPPLHQASSLIRHLNLYPFSSFSLAVPLPSLPGVCGAPLVGLFCCYSPSSSFLFVLLFPFRSHASPFPLMLPRLFSFSFFFFHTHIIRDHLRRLVVAFSLATTPLPTRQVHPPARSLPHPPRGHKPCPCRPPQS